MERKKPSFKRRQGRVQGGWNEGALANQTRNNNSNSQARSNPIAQRTQAVIKPRSNPIVRRTQPEAKRLRDGLVLLPRFLSIENQLFLVNAINKTGHENFFVPSNSDNKSSSKPSLHKLNMGTRGRLIGPIDSFPSKFKELCISCLKAAQSCDPTLPSMTPTTLLVNMYQANATFKWHQDSEHPSRTHNGRGRPIISFSVGLNADFGIKTHYDSHTHETIKLTSGDVLIFGGHSRMLVTL